MLAGRVDLNGRIDKGETVVCLRRRVVAPGCLVLGVSEAIVLNGYRLELSGGLNGGCWRLRICMLLNCDR